MNLKIIAMIVIFSVVAIPLSLIGLNAFGLIGNMGEVTDGIIEAVYAAIIFAIIAFIVGYVLKNKKIGLERETQPTLPVLREEKKQRYYTIYFPKGKRSEFLLTALSLLVIGSFSILMFQGLLRQVETVQLGQDALTVLGFMRVVVTVFPPFLVILGVWFLAGLINSVRFDRQRLNYRKISEFVKLTESFETSFKAAKIASNPSVRIDMLRELQATFTLLCEKYEWRQIKDKIEKVMNIIIPERISNDAYRTGHIELLVLISNRFPENTLTVIGDKWRLELERMLAEHSENHQETINVFHLLQEINRYKFEYMEKIVDDACNEWSDEKFSILSEKIKFKELRKTDKDAYEKINEAIVHKMDEAAGKNSYVYNRLKILHNLAYNKL